MAKVEFTKWKPEVELKPMGTEGYFIPGSGYWKTGPAMNGRSKGKTQCPCCETITEIYLWSFFGGGKRCSGCNVFLGHSGAFVSLLEMKNGIDRGVIKPPQQ